MDKTPVIVQIGSEAPLILQLAPLIAGVALVVAAFVTYRLTLRLEHRKWLRQERLKAYEGYAAYLRSLQVAKRRGGFAKDQLNQIIAWGDQLKLIGSDGIVEISRSQYKTIAEALKGKDLSEFNKTINKCHKDFIAVARSDMGTDQQVV